MWFWIFSIALIFIFVNFFIFSYICFRNACGRQKPQKEANRERSRLQQPPEPVRQLLPDCHAWLAETETEPVSVCAKDGLILAGQLLYANAPVKGVILLFHGYHSSCQRDFAIQAKTLHDAGYHLILVSQRAHGNSEGKYICFGVKERWDVGAWCCLAQQRFGELPIGLMGLSMGAATVLMSAGTPLPTGVRCIVGDCGFTTPWAITIRALQYRHKIYPYPVIYFMNYWCRLLAGYDYRDATVPEAMKQSKLPVLLLHGEADRYVPADMSREIAALDPERIELVLIPHATHGKAVFYDPEQYLSRLLHFFDTHMTKKTG